MPCSSAMTSQNLAPIWLPHCPPWTCTSSRMAAVASEKNGHKQIVLRIAGGLKQEKRNESVVAAQLSLRNLVQSHSLSSRYIYIPRNTSTYLVYQKRRVHSIFFRWRAVLSCNACSVLSLRESSIKPYYSFLQQKNKQTPREVIYSKIKNWKQNPWQSCRHFRASLGWLQVSFLKAPRAIKFARNTSRET